MKTCHMCQAVGKPTQNIKPAPLRPVSPFDELFSMVMIDSVDLIWKTKSRNIFFLTIMYAPKTFPETIPLRKITSRVITKVLTKMFT